MHEALSAVKGKAEKKGLLLKVVSGLPAAATIHTDRIRLRQILVNLLGNAVKFTEHGEITLTAECVQDDDGPVRMKFAVSDTGIGIPAAQLGDIFQPFRQVDGTFHAPLTAAPDLAWPFPNDWRRRSAARSTWRVNWAGEAPSGLTVDAGPQEGFHMGTKIPLASVSKARRLRASRSGRSVSGAARRAGGIGGRGAGRDAAGPGAARGRRGGDPSAHSLHGCRVERGYRAGQRRPNGLRDGRAIPKPKAGLTR